MAATSEVKQVHTFTDPLSRPVMEQNNPDLYRSDMPRMYPIHRHINIFSVARRGFEKRHPYFNGTLRGCKPGERYVLCYRVPDPPQQIAVDAERGGKRVEVEPRDEAGWRVAIDILNPNNPSTDSYYAMNAKQAAYYSVGEGVNLVKYGLFPSLNNEPTEEELLRAEAARDKSYQDLVDEAFQEQTSNPQNFRNWLRAHPDITEAMDALGLKADWHSKPEVKMTCPNCGDAIKAGLAFHKSSAGVLCVLDWKKAVEAGAAKKDDVPESKRWEGFEPRRGPGRPPSAA
jgi:hypothetical protein